MAARVSAPGAQRVCGIETSIGLVSQSSSPAARALRRRVANGGVLLQRGARSAAAAADDPQFWALDAPTTPRFVSLSCVPPEAVPYPYIVSGVLRPGARFVTVDVRDAEGVPTGGLEVVCERGGVMDVVTRRLV
jgi:hypothetical protein